MLQAELFNELHRWVRGRWRSIQLAGNNLTKAIADVMGQPLAQGDAQRFRAVLVEYQKAPQVTRDRMYLDAMQQVYSNVTKVLVESRQGIVAAYGADGGWLDKHAHALMLRLGFAYEQARGGFPAPKFLRSIEESPLIAPELQPQRM